MIRFLVDESSGQTVVEHLRALGYDVVAVGEAMPQAPDDQVIDFAFHARRVLITNDRDFGEKVFRYGRPHKIVTSSVPARFTLYECPHLSPHPLAMTATHIHPITEGRSSCHQTSTLLWAAPSSATSPSNPSN